MLLLHQQGTVKIGEVVRYTITYTPADDRILPSPPHLWLKIKNTSVIALRAAFIHGPYTLYVSSSPSAYHPNEKFEHPNRDGVPEFEPQLKAGASWQSQLYVPENIRETAGSGRPYSQRQASDGQQVKSISWVVEVASQVIFSNSAAVHYEVLLGRDEKSLSLGFSGLSDDGIPGQVSDHQQSRGAKDGHHSAQSKGVFSRAIRLRVDDTASLWNKPKLPEWDDNKQRSREQNSPAQGGSEANGAEHRDKRQKKVHLVVLTHGLHSNLGADLLYLKESIDEATEKAIQDARARRAKRRQDENEKASATGVSHDEWLRGERQTTAGKEKAPAEQKEDNTDEAEDDEVVIVRGFSGNAVRTEKGIKYLGKRLAKFVLAMTYPDQPFKPIMKTPSAGLKSTAKHDSKDQHTGQPAHSHSTIRQEPYHERKLAYKITSISFVAHSLGGLIQTYAVAYIQKHSPNFFDLIKPVNFVALATPFLGLSNENPIYVKFALDFGFVGRTGQDLGLTWRPPTIARSGWGAIVSGIGEGAHKKVERHQDPGSKPLLRILPTGPAHTALKKFRNRTVYSNVVNDGIVPLRTSCLLFLDWQGLGRVEKARRENGLVGTVAGWGWAELTGSNASAAPRRPWVEEVEGADSMDETDTANTPTRQGKGSEVPQPSENEAITADDDARSLKIVDQQPALHEGDVTAQSLTVPTSGANNNSSPLDTFLDFFRMPNPAPKVSSQPSKQAKIYRRSQTIKLSDENKADAGTTNKGASNSMSSGATSDEPDSLSAPPRTSFFESAGDLLNPPLTPVEWLIDPSARPRTIFHDRVYHPDDIPPPPLKRRTTSSLARLISSHPASPPPAHDQDGNSSLAISESSNDVIDDSAMKVEEKIARAYHRDLTWRKVLVRLEPDAHNNMIVRRKFANAYGWPVIKHLVDTHFSDQAVATMRDEDESRDERAKESNERPTTSGDEVNDLEEERHQRPEQPKRTNSESRESTDHIAPLNSLRPGNLARTLNRPARYERQDSAQWSDGDFMDSDGDSDMEPHLQQQQPLATNLTINPARPSSHQKTASGTSWNWTEAIVGKGASSPRGTHTKDADDFFVGGLNAAQVGSSGDEEEHTISRKPDEDSTTAPRIVHEVSQSLGLGRPSSGVNHDGKVGLAEYVARSSQV